MKSVEGEEKQELKLESHGVGVQGKKKSDMFWLTFYMEYTAYSVENCLGVEVGMS